MQVAPYVGAWIETAVVASATIGTMVAPYVGAWIETYVKSVASMMKMVAPYVGAWIETIPGYMVLMTSTRRTLRGCVD